MLEKLTASHFFKQFFDPRSIFGNKISVKYREMPYLTYTKGEKTRPLAIVRGGDMNGRILYLNTEEGKKSDAPKKEIQAVKYINDLKHLKHSDRILMMKELAEAHKKGVSVEDLKKDDVVKKVYERIITEEEKDTSVELPEDSCFELIPTLDENNRDVIRVAGQSGSGKSYWVKKFAENYQKIWPDRNVYLISQLEEDATLDSMKNPPKRISIQSLMDDFPHIDEFTKCCVIFDDIDSLESKLLKVVLRLIDTLAIQGRHTQTTLCVISHHLTDYSRSRLLLNECQYMVLYPMATAQKALSYVCTNYGGLSNDDIKDLKKLGRWVVIYKNFPPLVISAHKAYLLHH
jgi:type II secretory pathway predicted ATPase ExeA